MKVQWKPYKPGDDVPEGEYWLVIDGISRDGVENRHAEVGERVYSKPHPIFRTDDLGGCDDIVTHYAPFERPTLPEITP